MTFPITEGLDGGGGRGGLVNCLIKCVELSRNLCWCVVFSISFLDFPESHCNSNESVWPRLGHFDLGRLSPSPERALFHFSLFFHKT